MRTMDARGAERCTRVDYVCEHCNMICYAPLDNMQSRYAYGPCLEVSCQYFLLYERTFVVSIRIIPRRDVLKETV